MQINFSNTSTIHSKPMKPWQGILFGLTFAIIGIVLLFFAISSIKTYNEKNETFIETLSKVVDYEYNNEGLQAIIVEYVVDGQTYQKVSNTYSNMPKNIGTEVSIKYNPNNPKDAIWSSDSTNIVLPLFGSVLIIVGIIVIIISIKNVKKQNLVEEQIVQQPNGLYSNIEMSNQSSINNMNSQTMVTNNNVERSVSQPQMNNISQSE